jgi:hypothetical protein
VSTKSTPTPAQHAATTAAHAVHLVVEHDADGDPFVRLEAPAGWHLEGEEPGAYYLRPTEHPHEDALAAEHTERLLYDPTYAREYAEAQDEPGCADCSREQDAVAELVAELYDTAVVEWHGPDATIIGLRGDIEALKMRVDPDGFTYADEHHRVPAALVVRHGWQGAVERAHEHATDHADEA